MTAIGTALSALQASIARLNASASNIANADSVGPVPPTPPPTPPSQPVVRDTGQAGVYQALRVQQGDVAGGGTTATYRPTSPAYVLRSDPTSPYANAFGMIATPNVDTASELVGQLDAAQAFKAGIKIIQASDQLNRSLLERWA